MRVIPDQDERDLAAMCRSLLAAECPTRLARAPAGERITAGLWKALTEAGVLGLAIEEQHGGSGGADVALPVVASPPQRWRMRVSGVTDFAADGDLADVFVITADAGDCTLMCVADTRASGIGVEPVAMMGGHNAFTVRFDDVAVDEAVAVRDQDVRRVANAVVALLCLDLVGVGEALVQRTRGVPARLAALGRRGRRSQPAVVRPDYARRHGYRDIVCPPLYLQYAILGVAALGDLRPDGSSGAVTGSMAFPVHRGGWPAARAPSFTCPPTTATRLKWRAPSIRSSKKKAGQADSCW